MRNRGINWKWQATQEPKNAALLLQWCRLKDKFVCDTETRWLVHNARSIPLHCASFERRDALMIFVKWQSKVEKTMNNHGDTETCCNDCIGVFSHKSYYKAILLFFFLSFYHHFCWCVCIFFIIWFWVFSKMNKKMFTLRCHFSGEFDTKIRTTRGTE